MIRENDHNNQRHQIDCKWIVIGKIIDKIMVPAVVLDK